MINLRNRTEFSFRTAYGRVPSILEVNQGVAAGMCDRGGTWGHVQWQIECRKRDIKPLFGAEIAFVKDMDERERQGRNYMAFLAVNNTGLRELYELVSLATEKFYYEPRLDYSVLSGISENLIILSGSNPNLKRFPRRPTSFVELSPTSAPGLLQQARDGGFQVVATGDNYYCTPEDRKAYEIVVGERNINNSTAPQHIISEWEWRLLWEGAGEDPLKNTYLIAEMCNAELQRAEMVIPEKPKPLMQMCEEAAERRGVDLSNPIYRERLEREIGLILEKKYEDYFYVVMDMCQYAKKHMFVGPARGSSCGSLACYLMDITDIDPIPYNLLFERFIDINRFDIPDIDIDFQDDRREMVFDYLRGKYGADCVARLGTVSRFKAKSTITDVSKALKIPQWEVEDLKGAIIERSGGDSRARFCIMDTFEQLETGRRTLEKYPELEVATQIEGHARHTGQHAAGILVTGHPVNWYCSVNENEGVAQIDKYDAETVNLLKIDCLGLRTLALLQDVLDQVGWSRENLITYPTTDKAAIEVINKEQFAGIFQFEGFALQSLCRQMTLEHFEDIVSLTALARPGPLASGGSTEFLERRRGEVKVEYLHPMAEDITRVTYGVIVYQEQVMQIAREIGSMSWEDVSSLRKAMSKSLGKEFFDQYWNKFKVGANSLGIGEVEARAIWDKINTMGSWAFNRSHAVAYGMISYWCCVLKSKFPLEFAAACLRNAKDDDQVILVLRELVGEGYDYLPYDKDHSEYNWSVKGGKLIGGLIGIKGVGAKTAQDIITRRKEGRALTARQKSLLETGITPYNSIHEGRDKWGHIFDNPGDYNITSDLYFLGDIKKGDAGTRVFIAKLQKKNLRDLNEPRFLEKRGGVKMEGQTLYLFLTLEDDTGSIITSIARHRYLQWGVPIVEDGKVGDWYIWKGVLKPKFRIMEAFRWKKLTGNPEYEKH